MCRCVAFHAFHTEWDPDAAMATYPIVPTADVAQKFLVLIDQRRANLADLYESGRWQLYYSADELRARVRDLVMLRDKWAAVAALGGNGLPALRRWEAGSAAQANRADRAAR
jgi:hypothetical protein